MTTQTAIPDGKWAGQIPDFARRIGEAAQARRVVLFGSAARGEMGKDSDLDFLVVIPDSDNRYEMSDAWKRAYYSLDELKRPPVDILVATESRIRRLRDCPYGPIKFALDEGVEVWRDGKLNPSYCRSTGDTQCVDAPASSACLRNHAQIERKSGQTRMN